MGCDIHEFIELTITDAEGQKHTNYVGRIDLGRDYTLFALMAGVRYESERMNGVQPVAKPKGIPADLSWMVKDDYGTYVREPGDMGDYGVELERAKKWLASGESELLSGTMEAPTCISSPDWHSASWLTLDELKEVGRRYRTITAAPNSWFQSADQEIPEGAIIKKAETGWMARRGMVYVEVGEREPLTPYIGFDALIAMMEVLNKVGESRLTFWFDN